MTTYRLADPRDSLACFELFEAAIDDLGRRTGGAANATAGDPAAWDIRRPLFDHLAATCDQWWIAEDEATGAAVGYARSILRDGVRELTEFFVAPSAQGGGIGRGLLERAFPADGARHRAIVATIDPRAIARYLREGLDARVPMAGFEAAPRDMSVETDLVREPILAEAPPYAELAAIDRAVLDFRRDEEHEWLAGQRTGWLYRRDGAAVAYGYHAARPTWGGPFAALGARDLPVLLADAESAAAAAGHPTVTFDVPLSARAAVDHLLGRGFRVDPFVMLFFTDGPTEGLDRYVLTSPPFFA
ncbi:MAG: N-acetyltransferase family protein [Candidatus Limnocylindrales bacterium]